jgi:hypothetical protein
MLYRLNGTTLKIEKFVSLGKTVPDDLLSLATEKVVSKVIGQCFQPILREIENMISELFESLSDVDKEQVNSSGQLVLFSSLLVRFHTNIFQVVVLVGGLSSSPYIYKELAGYVDRFLVGRAKLIRPDRSWSAIATGAALASLGSSTITARKADRHIGICTHQRFDEALHKEADRFECPVGGSRARDQMVYILHKVMTHVCGRGTRH